MRDECVLAVYDDVQRAQEAIHILGRGGFPLAQVSLVAKSPHGGNSTSLEVPVADNSVRDAAIGAGLGATIGALGGIVVTVAAGAALVFLIGPLAATGAIAGAFLGGLGGWGVHSERIAHYEKLVRQGKTLVIAHGSPEQLLMADQILMETGAAEIRVYAKTETESPEVYPQESMQDKGPLAAP